LEYNKQGVYVFTEGLDVLDHGYDLPVNVFAEEWHWVLVRDYFEKVFPENTPLKLFSKEKQTIKIDGQETEVEGSLDMLISDKIQIKKTRTAPLWLGERIL
jgi:hypothetical protein